VDVRKNCFSRMMLAVGWLVRIELSKLLE